MKNYKKCIIINALIINEQNKKYCRKIIVYNFNISSTLLSTKVPSNAI